MGNVSLEWNVYVGNFNSGRIETDNVFRHTGFLNSAAKTIRKFEKEEKLTGEFDIGAFTEEIRRDLMYYFWCKCEWEVVISHWPKSEHCPEKFRDLKIDVYDQVWLNKDIFIDYVLRHRKEIKKCATAKKN